MFEKAAQFWVGVWMPHILRAHGSNSRFCNAPCLGDVITGLFNTKRMELTPEEHRERGTHID